MGVMASLARCDGANRATTTLLTRSIGAITALAVKLVASRRKGEWRSRSCPSSADARHQMIITEATRLPGLVDLVHDCWFDVEKIEFDRERKRAAFRVEPNRSYLA